MMTVEQKEQKVLAAIRQAALHDQPCPTNADLAELIGSCSAGSAAVIVRRLEEKGKISISRHGWARTIFFDDGRHTMPPSYNVGGARCPDTQRAPIDRQGRGAPCSGCGCRGDACTCGGGFRATKLPSSAARSIVTATGSFG